MSDFGRGGRAIAGAAESMSFDEFMRCDPSGGGGGSGGFFKWKDQKSGSADIWLHTKRPCIAFPNHSWKRIVEVKDKETKIKEQRVFSDRWGCLESKEVIENQYFRDKATGQFRKLPPKLCPMCLFVEHCFQQIFVGNWEPTKPIFHFEGTRRDETTTFSAGAMCGWFTDKRFEKDPSLARKCKMAGIRRDEVWKDKLLTQKQFLFTLVSDANPGNGVQTTFEKISLTKAVLKAIEDEKTKEQRKKSKGNVELADPSKHPYRFAWEFDGEKDINSMYSCVALRDGEDPPEDILELINSDPPDVSHLISEGDCYALRGQMEAHLCEGVEIPWDEIFGPAEKAGRMNPPEESRADAEGESEDGADDEDPGAFFEKKAAEIQNTPAPEKLTDRSVNSPKPAKTDLQEAGLVDDPEVIKVDSPIWAALKKGGTIPLPEVKGREVHLDVPEGTDDKHVEKLRAMLEKLGATGVAEIVPCEHCGEAMTTFDGECSKCGAQVDDSGGLLTRPCLEPECSGQVPNAWEGEATICPKCGTIHLMSVGVWQIANKEEEKPAAAPRRGSRRGAAPPFARPAS